MSTRHYIIVQQNDKVIYTDQILGNNDFFDEDFKYYSEDNDYEFVEKTQVDLKYLMIYWRKWLARKNKETIKLLKDFKEPSDLKILKDLVLGNYYILQPFFLMNKLLELNCINIANMTLKEDCKMFLEVY